jgi:hypothetical protein
MNINWNLFFTCFIFCQKMFLYATETTRKQSLAYIFLDCKKFNV